MKVLGLIGGMSWESSAEYYRIINQEVKARLGGWHSARCILYSVDFAEIATLQHAGRWTDTAHLLVGAARRLERADADAIVLCTNTMHKLAPEIEADIDIPLIHIVDVTARRIASMGLARVGLLGTRFTMEDGFYRDGLASAGIDVVVPGEADRALVHEIIYDELCLGTVSEASRANCLGVIERLVEAGAQAVVLGCTELPILLRPGDCATPLLDTTRIHAEAAVEFALARLETPATPTPVGS